MSFLNILEQLAFGLGHTLLVTFVCSVTALVAGFAIACARQLGGRRTASTLDIFTYVFRGIPVLVMLFMVYFGLPSVGLRVSPLVAMALSLGLISAAYLSEVFRGALQAVAASEILAAQASGMTRLQIFLYIEAPQMLRFAVPGMINEFTSILKYSPFAYTVGIPEMTKQAMNLTATTLQGIEVYLAVGILYFLIYWILIRCVRLIEKYYRVPGIGVA
ncbi:MAG: amino acid ABC transporter permease [Alcaligenaceae bacterium]